MAIFNAIFPILALTTLGYLLRRFQFVPDSAWPSLEKINYWVFLPCLMFYILVEAPLEQLRVVPIIIATACSIIIVSLLLILFRGWAAKNPPRLSSLIQGSIRFNNYVGLSAVHAYFGAMGLVVSSLYMAITVPLANIICVLSLLTFGLADPAKKIRHPMIVILANPLIIGSGAGIIFAVSGWHLLPSVYFSIKAISQAALPMGLLTVGAALRLGDIRHQRREMAVSMVFKFAVLPLITLGLGTLLMIPKPVLAVLLVMQALPTATSGYILARQMGGDASLMSNIISMQTVAALVTLPVTLLLVKLI